MNAAFNNQPVTRAFTFGQEFDVQENQYLQLSYTCYLNNMNFLHCKPVYQLEATQS